MPQVLCRVVVREQGCSLTNGFGLVTCAVDKLRAKRLQRLSRTFVSSKKLPQVLATSHVSRVAHVTAMAYRECNVCTTTRRSAVALMKSKFRQTAGATGHSAAATLATPRIGWVVLMYCHAIHDCGLGGRKCPFQQSVETSVNDYDDNQFCTFYAFGCPAKSRGWICTIWAQQRHCLRLHVNTGRQSCCTKGKLTPRGMSPVDSRPGHNRLAYRQASAASTSG